jgi:hypothetical protein
VPELLSALRFPRGPRNPTSQRIAETEFLVIEVILQDLMRYGIPANASNPHHIATPVCPTTCPPTFFLIRSNAGMDGFRM